MRLLLYALIGGVLFLALSGPGRAQAPAAPPSSSPAPDPQAAKVLELCQAEIDNLRTQETALQTQAQDEETKKKIELMQKQIDTLEKMIKLIAEQLRKGTVGGAAVEQLQAQEATLESRSVQAAHRDSELASAVDDLREHVDAQERYGPDLPSQLKELFLPSGNNETVLSIYGALSVGYNHIQNTPGGFYFGEFTPDFILQLNDWVTLEAEIGIGSDGSVNAGSFAQADFFINDWLTLIAGRFVAPIGWFNERLNNPWVNKLPTDAPGSFPLLWLQVLPAFSMLGVQAQGSCYLGCSPFKIEYNAYVSNGLNFTPATPGSPTIDELANLENMEDTFSVITNEKAVGGRVGFWWPEKGLEVGFSAMYNGDYVNSGGEDSMSLWAADFNFHRGDWDVRAEYGMMYQQAQNFVVNNIVRQGFYGQIAYRPRDSHIRYLENTEFVYRYSYVNFEGIDPTTLNLSSYASPVDVPVRRQQNEFGIDYWFSPRLALKCAYQINDEQAFHLNDNQFLVELDWGW